MVPILQNKIAYYCEFYWAVNFVVRDTVTIPHFIVVRSTVAIQLAIATSKKYSLSLDIAGHYCCCCQYPIHLFMDISFFYPRTNTIDKKAGEQCSL